MPDGRYFEFSIATPEGVVAEARAEFVCLPGVDGEFGVLYDRSPLLVRLRPGIVRARMGDHEDWYFVAGGFGDVINNHLTVLTPRALAAKEVNAQEARAARDRARRMGAPDAATQRKVLDAYAEAHALDRMLARTGR
jgi:F-type H+-transporting ATPase subunit epsilon